MTLASSTAANTPVRRLNHIIYATPDLELGIETHEELLGVRAILGGQHPGHGTRTRSFDWTAEPFSKFLDPIQTNQGPIVPAGSASIVCDCHG
jgi:hypothetical protein